MLRKVLAVGVAGVAAVLVDVVVLLMSSRFGGLRLAQAYAGKNLAWIGQLNLLLIVLGFATAVAAAGGGWVAGPVGWPTRVWIAAVAAVEGLICVPVVRAWAAGATGVADPVGQATEMALLGLVIGGMLALLAVTLPSVRLGFLVYFVLWLVDLLLPAPRTPQVTYYLAVVGWLLLPVLGGLIGFWAAGLDYRAPVLGAVAYPLFALFTSTVVYAILRGDRGAFLADLRSLTSITLTVAGLAGLAAVVGHSVRSWAQRRSDGTPGPHAPLELDADPPIADLTQRSWFSLLIRRVTADRSHAPALLCAAGALFTSLAGVVPDTRVDLGVVVMVALGPLAVTVGLLAGRGLRLGPLLGPIVVAVAFGAVPALLGPQHLRTAAVWVQLSQTLLYVVAVTVVGLLARTPRAVAGLSVAILTTVIAWCGVAARTRGIQTHDIVSLLPGFSLIAAASVGLLFAFALAEPRRPPILPLRQPAVKP